MPISRMPWRPQQAAVDQFACIAKLAGWLVVVPGDDQQGADARLIAKPPDEPVDIAGAGEAAHREMRHRLEARGPQQRSRHDRFVRCTARDGADIDACAPAARSRPMRRSRPPWAVSLRANSVVQIPRSPPTGAATATGVPPCSLNARRTSSLAPARDHVGFVVEPQAAVLRAAPRAWPRGSGRRRPPPRAGHPRSAPRRSRRSTPRTASRCRSTSR